MKNLFTEHKIETILKENTESLERQIASLPETNFLSEKIGELSPRLLRSYTLEVPSLDKEKVRKELKSQEVKNFPSGYRFDPYQKYIAEVARYNVPFTGNPNFFGYRPTKTSGGVIAEVKNGYISFEYLNWETLKITGDDKAIEGIKALYNSQLFIVESYLNNLSEDIAAYNQGLKQKIDTLIDGRIKAAKKRQDTLNKL